MSNNRNLSGKITKAANDAQRQVHSNEAPNYRDNRHNQYANAFASNLHQQNVPFQRTPTVEHGGRSCKPDFVVDKSAVVEVKAKSGGFSAHDRNVQMAGYKDATNLPVYGVNFGKSGGPNVKKF